MDYSKYDNSIIICQDNAKESIIKDINSLNRLINIKVITISELKKKYYFDYTKEAIYQVSKYYNVISEIAKIYIDNIYYIMGKELDEKKVLFLHNIKNFLDERKLLKYDIFFKNYLTNKKIVLYNLDYVDKFYQNIFNKLKEDNKISEYHNTLIDNKKEIYALKNKEEEIVFVASSIVKLIKKGIDINKIKLINVSNEYIFTIKKVFKFFNIPIILPSITSLSGTVIVNKFKENFTSNKEELFDSIKSYIHSECEEEIYKKLINIVNDYAWCDDITLIKDIIFNDIDNMSLENSEFKNALRCIELGSSIKEDEYIFLINFNQGVIPRDFKDEEYLNDDIRKSLNIDTSIDYSVNAIKEIQYFIKGTKNIIISWVKSDLKGELYISSAYDSEMFIEKDYIPDYTLSNSYNIYKLISLKDEFKKFGTVSDNLITLTNHYSNIPYDTFDNSFKGLDKDKVYNYLGNKLNLSYTSMNSYYECAYKYYLKHILKIDKFEDTFMTIVGKLFHKILSECFCDNYDIDSAWSREVSLIEYEFNAMEKFFLNNLKSELKLVIETITKQYEYTSLKSALYEQEIRIPVDTERNITFTGFIDKILYNEEENIVSIIDYKTGDVSLNLANIQYGLNMQLVVYLYLIKHFEKFKNARVGGFYLEKILDSNTSMEKRLENMKLQGYTNSDTSVTELVDSSYANSCVIKGLKTSSNGFYAYSKVLNDDEMNMIRDIVKEKITTAADNICNGEFTINPKEIDGVMYGCKHCTFKSICYMKNADIVKYKKTNLWGGEEDAKVD